jgi:hypothetical protein
MWIVTRGFSGSWLTFADSTRFDVPRRAGRYACDVHQRTRDVLASRRRRRYNAGVMRTSDIGPTLARLFSELVDGAPLDSGAFMLNSGDAGLLRSLDRLSAASASRSANDGATIAAHTQHLRYGLSLMNRWAREGGNPFADARWDEAWKISIVDEPVWAEIRAGLREEARRWHDALALPRDASDVELAGMTASVAHLAYHLGAIRQIDKQTRGPLEGTSPPKEARPLYRGDLVQVTPVPCESCSRTIPRSSRPSRRRRRRRAT